jgi:hypothetical protein
MVNLKQEILPNGNLKISVERQELVEFLEERWFEVVVPQQPGKSESPHPFLIIYSENDENERILAGSTGEVETPNIHNDQLMYDIMESLIANSDLCWVNPSDVGALTEAPILGNFDFAQVGAIDGVPQFEEVPDDAKLWFFEPYMVRSVLQELCEKGFVIFTEASPDVKEGSQKSGNPEPVFNRAERRALKALERKGASDVKKLYKPRPKMRVAVRHLGRKGC